MTDYFPDQLSFIDQGVGQPTLVFLHYFSGAAASWQWVIDILKAEYRCVALDLPGFGNAPPLGSPSLKNYGAFVGQAISQLKLDRVVLIGHSMGGKIALQVAADHISPGLEQVVLVAPSPATREPMPEAERDRLLAHPHSPENAEKTVSSSSQMPLPAARQSLAVETHIQAADSAWRWWLLEGMNHSIADQMERVQVPVTVLASSDDPVIPFQTIQQDVVNLLEPAELIVLGEVGHLIPLEAPERLAQTIHQVIG
ncbi:MAG: alpha/beta fold hydrolase [Leptolyngbyaceae cyanobacterium SM2_3_12]|nr:alpha/beta fold hydrolase [Leptolyngbyaceae cyanobacterium SM2_3_12]